MNGAPRPRVLIIGGGFGGLETARALAKAPVDITLVDKTNHHLFQPLLYQVATAGLAAPAIAAPIRSLFRSQGNLTTLLAEVVQIDAAGQQVLLSDGSSLVSDHLVVATGATHSYFGHDEWEQHAPGLKTLEDAFAEIARQTLIGEFRRIDPHHARILLLEGGPRVLQAMPADLSAKALT